MTREEITKDFIENPYYATLWKHIDIMLDRIAKLEKEIESYKKECAEKGWEL